LGDENENGSGALKEEAMLMKTSTQSRVKIDTPSTHKSSQRTTPMREILLDRTNSKPRANQAAPTVKDSTTLCTNTIQYLKNTTRSTKIISKKQTHQKSSSRSIKLANNTRVAK
jgi:hypothetical protein